MLDLLQIANTLGLIIKPAQVCEINYSGFMFNNDLVIVLRILRYGILAQVAFKLLICLRIYLPLRDARPGQDQHRLRIPSFPDVA
jgi:hypothetical protein